MKQPEVPTFAPTLPPTRKQRSKVDKAAALRANLRRRKQVKAAQKAPSKGSPS